MEECLELLLTRRSIRRFRREDVDDEVIFKMLDAARFAPSARNSQPWEFIVIRDRKVKEELGRVHRYASPLLNAPLGIAVICNPKLSPTSYLVDCANATIYAMLAAHALGLGTVWIQTLRDIEKIQGILGVPEDLVPVAILAVGWPDEKPEARPRKKLSEVTYLNSYGKRLP